MNVSNGTGSGGCGYAPGSAPYVLTCVIVAVGLSLTSVSMCAVFSLVRRDNVAPIYVINLLVADVVQLCTMTSWVVNVSAETCDVLGCFNRLGLVASVGFMVCISLERYLVVAWPVWYRFRRTIRLTLGVCVSLWALALLYLPCCLWLPEQTTEAVDGVGLLLPLPVLVFCLAGTLRALSAATCVPPDERRRIVALLALVLLTYTLLFLPTIVRCLAENTSENKVFDQVTWTVAQLSPLSDAFLYVLLRKGAVDKVLVLLCCGRADSN